MSKLEDLVIEWEDRPLYPGPWAQDFIERILEFAATEQQKALLLQKQRDKLLNQVIALRKVLQNEALYWMGWRPELDERITQFKKAMKTVLKTLEETQLGTDNSKPD